jgi:RHS repeat-associated protein
MVAHGRITLVSVFLFFLFGLSIPFADAQTVRYVSRTDTTCGGNAPCYRTIQSAINAAQPGDTILIRAGVYAEQLTIEKNNFAGAAEADRIVIESDPVLTQEQVILQGPGGSSCTNNFAIRIRRSKFITIRSLTITGAGAQAITMQGGSNGNQGIHLELNRIFGNGLSNNCSGAVEINDGNPGTVVANNVVYHNGRSGIVVLGSVGGPQYIVNNTIYANQWNGLDIAAGHSVLLANNIVNDNGIASGNQGTRFGVIRASSGTSTPQRLQLRNNLVCGNAAGELAGPILDVNDSGNFTPLGNEGVGVAALPGCESHENLFVNRNGLDNTPNTLDDDFSLKRGSLAIDVGMDLRTLGLDPSLDSIFAADFRQDGVRPFDGDADGNALFDASASEFSGDVIPPHVVIVSPNAGAYVRGAVNVSVQVTDSVAVTATSLSAGGVTVPTSSLPALPAPSTSVSGLWNTTGTNDGNASIIANATDSSTNTGSATVNVTVDNTAPDTQITGGPTSQIAQTSATFTFEGSDNLTPASSLVFAWRIDGGAWTSFNSSVSASVNNLASGAHTFEVKARDLAGNEDPTAAAQTFSVRIGPAITDVEPASGTIGILIKITGTDFEPGTTQVNFNGAAAVIRTMTASEIITTVPPTAMTGSLTVTTSRGSASRHFPVFTSQDYNLVISPSSVPTIQGGSARVLIEAIPTNDFAGLLQLATGSLPAGVTAQFTPPNLAPNNHATLTLMTSTGTPSGAHAVEVRATTSIDGQTVTRTNTVTLNVAAPGQTILVGQVLDGDERPLAGVSIKLGGTRLTHLGSSDAAGNLFIPVTFSGSTVLLIDASPANNATTNYPTIPITLNIRPGVINELGYTPRLRGQPVAKLIPFVPGQPTVITDPDLPGFKMTIPAGVQIIGWDGQPNNQFGVTTVPVDRSPLPTLLLPAGLEARETYLFSFGKVGGGVPTGNIPIDLPNNYGALPGEKVDLYYFNESPDGTAPNQWDKYGTATVSLDGTTLITDINPATGVQYGIPRFCCGALTPVFNFINRLFGYSGGPNDGGKNAGDPVDVSTGYFYVDKTDMVLPGRLPIVVTRTYRSNLNNLGPFGIGTSVSFDFALVSPDSFSGQAIVLISPGNRQDTFSLQANGTYINTTSPSLRGAVFSAAGLDAQRIYTLRFREGFIWQFNSSGQLIRQSDRNDNTITYVRDNFGRVINIQEPGGRSLSISYVGTPGEGLPNIRLITDPIGRQVLYTYDASARLESVTDPGGGITRYSYDSANRMVTITDPRGLTFLTNEYDTAGRIARQTEAQGGVWTFAYTNAATYISQAVITDPRGHATTYRFNAAGYQTSETDALGQTTTFERQTGTNQLVSVTDPLKRITRFQYDESGNVTRITDPAGNARTFNYHPTFNRVTSITDPLGNISRFEYSNAGNLSSYIDALGNRTTLDYNGFGQPISSTDAQGNTANFTYDAFGSLSEISDPLGNRVQRRYDPVFRLIEQSDPRGKVTSFTYNGLNQITGIKDPTGGVTQLNYDGNGNLLSVIDPRGSATLYSYDSKDQVATRTDPLGAMESFHYDAMGNLIRWVDRKGQQTQFVYDVLNRRVGGSYQDGVTTNVTYDAASRLVQATDSFAGSIANQFDSLDRLISQVTNLGRVRYAYDSIGRRTEMTVPGQASVGYSYDANSRLRQVVQGAQLVTLEYDTLNRRTQLSLPNGITTEYQYDAASRLTALIYRRALGVIGDIHYQYDTAGHRTGIGGSLARTMLPDPVSSAEYDIANRQLRFGNSTMNYDPTGNLITITDPAGVTNLIWDARSRLKDSVGPISSSSFVYDIFGRRAKKTIGGQSTQYLYDGVNPVQEYSGASVLANILSGLEVDEVFSRSEVSTAATSHFLPDALGSVMSLTDSDGNIQTNYTYEPFGKTQISGAPTTNSFQFTGRENDGNGMYYYRARYYHPSLQRFINEDPLRLAGGELNLFSYARNSTPNLRDPSGTIVQLPVVIAGLCGAGAVAGAAASHALAGRKSTFAGLLTGAAAGCAMGLGGGWLFGIGLEAALPSIMATGENIVLWGGVASGGAQLARAEAVVSGSATIAATFTGSALRLAEAVGFNGEKLRPLWNYVSRGFVSGAESATALIGPLLADPTYAAKSILVTQELPKLQQTGARVTYILLQ